MMYPLLIEAATRKQARVHRPLAHTSTAAMLTCAALAARLCCT